MTVTLFMLEIGFCDIAYKAGFIDQTKFPLHFHNIFPFNDIILTLNFIFKNILEKNIYIFKQISKVTIV